MSKSKDKRDIFYRKAKEEGWRARSAFKLLQIDETFNLFNNVTRAVDLCAAPGSWSQVLARKLIDEHSRIVAVDLQPMAPIDGVHTVQGDITSQRTVDEVLNLFREGDEERLADLVVCDGAPDVTGLHDIDDYIQGQLLLSALAITASLLRPGGSFVAKIFRGRGAPRIYARCLQLFREVATAKPRASRNSSAEAFIVCRGFELPAGFVRGVGLAPMLEDDDEAALLERFDPQSVPFVACGDLSGFDADANYDLDLAEGATHYEPIRPTQPPTTPAYRAYLEAQSSSSGRRVVLDAETHEVT